jgi:antitoxin CcdA
MMTAHNSRRIDQGPRRATNLSLSESLIEEARRANINLSKAAERGIAEELAEAKEASAQQWLAENADTLREVNEWVEKNGLPLAKHRLF